MDTNLLPASALATRAHPGMSARYVHINTLDVIRSLESEGFVVANVQSQRSRRRDPLYARHTVDFRHPDVPRIGDSTPRVLFSNSHDGSMRASVLAGVFRFVCSNGMVVGSTYASERVLHAGEAARTLIDRVRALARNTAPLFSQIEAWQRKDLSAAQRTDYARMAAVLRWGDAERFDPAQLLEVRRPEDEGSDLWRVFNRVQEATTRLALPGVARSGRAAQSRPLTAITADLRFNAQLWQLTEDVANV